MTVSELIEALSKCQPDNEVLIIGECGYFSGGIDLIVEEETNVQLIEIIGNGRYSGTGRVVKEVGQNESNN